MEKFTYDTSYNSNIQYVFIQTVSLMLRPYSITINRNLSISNSKLNEFSVLWKY